METIDLKSIPGYLSKKPYSHFDYSVSFRDAEEKVLNPDYVKHHGFYPLISNTLCHVRYRDGVKTLKTRDIAYAAHLDHRIYQYYALLWGQLYNARANLVGINDVAVAYRSGLRHTNISAAADAMNAIRSFDDALVITGDFSHFFDNLNHSYLLRAVREFFDDGSLPKDHYRVLRNILHYSCWPIADLANINGLPWIELEPDDPATYGNTAKKIRLNATRELNKLPRVLSSDLFKALKSSSIVLPWKKEAGTPRGIPQGLATSGVLANMYMFETDTAINEHVSAAGGKYIRYCDDFIIVVPAKRLDMARSILRLAQQVPDVELQPEKTKIHRVKNGRVKQLSFKAFATGEIVEMDPDAHPKQLISFLGFDFDGSYVRIRQSTSGRFFNRLYRSAYSIGRLADNPDKHPSKIRVTTLYENYSPKGSIPVGKHLASDRKRYGNYHSYVCRAQKAFPNDPIDKHVSKIYRKINKATKRT